MPRMQPQPLPSAAKSRIAVVPGALMDGSASTAAAKALSRINRMASPITKDSTIYESLRGSHELQRALLRQIVRIPASRPEQRKAVFHSLKTELAAHAAAEERFLYAPILMDDMGLDPSRHALSEHHEVDELVEDIEELSPSGEAWMEHVKKLAHKVRHHLKEEETSFFQTSGKILSDAEKLRLGRLYQRDHARMLKKLTEE